jgi:hypothetical protein
VPSDLERALFEFTRDAREAWLALQEAVGPDPLRSYRSGRIAQRGAGRDRRRRRVLWRFHGRGVYIRLAGLLPVDFDFAAGGAQSDLWKLEQCGRITTPGLSEVGEVMTRGLVGEHRAFGFHLDEG